MEWKLQKVRKLPDGRWQVIRSDGAMLSLSADDWRDALDWIEDMIGDDWTPTPENVNALPEPLRQYIHDLETRCDPAGELRERAALRDENAMLRGAVARLSQKDAGRGNR